MSDGISSWGKANASLRSFACSSWVASNMEFDITRDLDDALWMAAVLGKSVFQGLGAINEKTAKGAPLLASNPVTASVPANKNNRRC
ncbi:hypothetical protein IVB03_00165 [Bradyrhizobium sp. 168]|uniref:hypothetical protein n=1 Tax=Bradyrhizobium sp. 168 TaxID=2782639 RepID=UPI003211C6F3|nr:hypothetical protein [Bradyrhizobium sp. 168]